ncbi:hypothetical protein ACKWTF_013825 [Chironomus riparius]
MDQRLKDLLQRKAEVELRETELRKKQSLEQFREWLKKHPYLKRTRQDFTNVPMSVFTSVTLSEVLDWARAIISCPGRYKQNILINIPTIAMTFYNIVSMILPEKLRKRLVIVKNYEELKNLMDVSKLPEVFGGDCDEDVYIDETLKIFDEKLDLIRESNDYEIDVSQFGGKLHNDEVGSFRKLEID